MAITDNIPTEVAVVALGIDAIIGLIAYFSKQYTEATLNEFSNVFEIPDDNSVVEYLKDGPKTAFITGKLVRKDPENTKAEHNYDGFVAWKSLYALCGEIYNDKTKIWSQYKQPLDAQVNISDVILERSVKEPLFGCMRPLKSESILVPEVDRIPGFDELFKILGKKYVPFPVAQMQMVSILNDERSFRVTGLQIEESVISNSCAVTMCGRLCSHAGKFVIVKPPGSRHFVITTKTKEVFLDDIGKSCSMQRNIFRFCVVVGLGLAGYIAYMWWKKHNKKKNDRHPMIQGSGDA